MKNEKADSIQINRRYLDSLVIEGRIVGAKHPDTHVTVLGKTFETPIVPGALSHLKGGMAGYAEGAAMAGVLKQMTGELRGIMARTGSVDLKHIDSGVIHPICF